LTTVKILAPARQVIIPGNRLELRIGEKPKPDLPMMKLS
jgi:hypothetical protein